MKLLQKLDLRYPTNKSKQRYRYGLFECPNCNTQIEAILKNGIKYKSCNKCKASIISASMTTHGLTSSNLYRVWIGIKSRCLNVNNKRYKDYGGRGITVCDQWINDPEAFCEWAENNGYTEGLTIDRVDNDKGYYPDNCRFTTRGIQQRNTRILRSTNTSGYRGVSWNKCKGKWLSMICVNYKYVFIGYYETPIEAAKAYDIYILENKLEHTINGVNNGEKIEKS